MDLDAMYCERESEIRTALGKMKTVHFENHKPEIFVF